MAVRINNREYAWGDISILVGGQPVAGARAINYKVSQSKEALVAAGREPRAIQKGQRSYEGSLTVLQSELMALNRSARAAGYQDLLGADISIIVAYAMDGVTMTLDRIDGVNFSEYSVDASTDSLYMEVELPFVALGIEMGVVF